MIMHEIGSCLMIVWLCMRSKAVSRLRKDSDCVVIHEIGRAENLFFIIGRHQGAEMHLSILELAGGALEVGIAMAVC